MNDLEIEKLREDSIISYNTLETNSSFRSNRFSSSEEEDDQSDNVNIKILESHEIKFKILL